MRAGRLLDLATTLQAYLSVIYFLVLPVAPAPTGDQQGDANKVNYGVLLDAGSSSTKLKVYRWNASDSDSLVPQLDLITNERFANGLGSYGNDDKNLTLYLQEIIAKAKADVPSNRHGETPIYLMATAGLRLLSSVDAYTLMEKTRSIMANKSINPFLYLPSRVSVLSGEEEGVYSWIAANYLLGFFDKPRPVNESVGILEMGGGSTQIAFVPKGDIFSEEFQVVVAGRPYQLYVQSYLQFGSNAIRDKIAYELSLRYPESKEVANPCMLIGDTRTTELENGTFITETGSGSPLVCLEILKEILKPYTGVRCQPKPCAIGSVHQPSTDNIKFIATQAFTYTPASLKVVGQDEILNIDALEKAAIQYCNKSLQRASEESGTNNTYASDDCLMGLYIPTLFTVSYGFSRNTTNIRVTSKIGKSAIDWSLGAMLVELSSSFSSPKSNYSVTCKTAPLSDNGSRGNHSPLFSLWKSAIVLLSILFFIVDIQ